MITVNKAELFLIKMIGMQPIFTKLIIISFVAMLVALIVLRLFFYHKNPKKTLKTELRLIISLGLLMTVFAIFRECPTLIFEKALWSDWLMKLAIAIGCWGAMLYGIGAHLFTISPKEGKKLLNTVFIMTFVMAGIILTVVAWSLVGDISAANKENMFFNSGALFMFMGMTLMIIDRWMDIFHNKDEWKWIILPIIFVGLGVILMVKSVNFVNEKMNHSKKLMSRKTERIQNFPKWSGTERNNLQCQ
ncbi:MAG: hypothetical protein U9Q34_00220 [Elusimicrobiota bacterium]|nr:hypothetical protein [Elusimicrobiota bacterium]